MTNDIDRLPPVPGERESDWWRKGKRLLIEVEFTSDIMVYDSAIMKSLYADATKKDGSIAGEFTVQKIYVNTFKNVAEMFKEELVQKLDEIIDRA
jgi:hypothetical protein